MCLHEASLGLYVCVDPIFHPGGKYHQPNLMGHPLSVAPKVKRMNYILSFQCLLITIWVGGSPKAEACLGAVSDGLCGPPMEGTSWNSVG